MSSSFSQFKPYKRILDLSVSANAVSLLEKKKKKKSKTGKASATTHSSCEIISCASTEVPQSSIELNVNCIDSKDNKENDGNEEIQCEDVSILEDCCIVLDSNANEKQSGSSYPQMNICNSPDRILNTNSPSNTDHMTPKRKKKRRRESNHLTPIRRSKRVKSNTLVCLGEQIPALSLNKDSLRNQNQRPEKQCDVIDNAKTMPRMLGGMSTMASNISVIEILDDTSCSSLPSTVTSTNSAAANVTKSSNSHVAVQIIDQVRVSEKKLNDTITIDESFILGETVCPDSDVAIIDDKTVPVKNNFTQDPLIVDLVKISAPLPSRFKNNSESQSSCSSNTPAIEVLAHHYGSTAAIIPLEVDVNEAHNRNMSRGTHIKLGVNRRSKKIKSKKQEAPRLIKSKKNRKTILKELSSLSPTTGSSGAATSMIISSASTKTSATPAFIPIGQTAWSNLNNAPFSTPYFASRSENPNSVGRLASRWDNPNRVAPVKCAAQRTDDNIYNPIPLSEKTGLRPVMIDGSNVAFEYLKDATLGPRFNAKGIELMVDFFKKRGHKDIKVFIPSFRQFHSLTLFPEILEKLQKEGYIIHTPSRKVNGSMQVPYDDRLIVQAATELGGVIVSNDRYRDIMQENERWRETIEKRLLMFIFVNEMIMFPQDPHGRHGPNLNTILRF